MCDICQLYDYRTGHLAETITWDTGVPGQDIAMLYAAQFSRDGRFIAAGGTGTNDCRVFDRSNHNVVRHHDSTCTLTCLRRAHFTHRTLYPCSAHRAQTIRSFFLFVAHKRP